MFVKATFEYMDENGIGVGIDNATFNDEGAFFAYLAQFHASAERVPEIENCYWDEFEMCNITYELHED